MRLEWDENKNRENLQKLYVQLCDIIKRKIEGKEWGVGLQIPTEDELCRAYEVSRATVRAASSAPVEIFESDNIVTSFGLRSNLRRQRPVLNCLCLPAALPIYSLISVVKCVR